MFALAVETRQYIRHILYPLLCQVNFSKFILCPRLRFYECEMGIIWKKPIQAHNRATWKHWVRVLECTLSSVLYHITSCNLTPFSGYTCLLHEWCSLSLQALYFVYLHMLARSRRAWRGCDSLPVLQKACPKSWAIALPSHPWACRRCCTGVPAHRTRGEGRSCGTGQGLRSWMWRWTRHPPRYHLYLPCRLFLRRGCVHQLVGCSSAAVIHCLPAVVSPRLGPAVSHSTATKANSFSSLLGAQLFTCSKPQKAGDGGKDHPGQPLPGKCAAPPGSCWEVGFQNRLLWLKRQELACQPLPSNYSRLICNLPCLRPSWGLTGFVPSVWKTGWVKNQAN